MKLIKYKSTKKLHPTDKELADFIDNKLSSQKQDKLLIHLLYCDRCTCIIVIETINSKKSIK